MSLDENQNPHSPWMSRKEWRTGTIRCKANESMHILVLGAFVWNSLIAGAFFVFYQYGEVNSLKWILILFACLGLFLVWLAALSILEWIRFGSSFFEMTTKPGVIGGKLRGNIKTKLPLTPELKVRTTLSCIHTRIYPTRQGRRRPIRLGRRRKTRSTDHEVLWQDECELSSEQLSLGESGVTIPISFTIPYGLQPYDDSNPDNKIEWSLNVYADIPGIDYQAQFDVPVFITPQSRPESKDERENRLSAK